MRDDIRPAKRKEMWDLVQSNFNNAEIIFGVDEVTGNRFVAYGRPLLEEIAALPDDETRTCSIKAVSIIQRTTELEALLAAVQVCRGHDDYEATELSVTDGSSRLLALIERLTDN